MISKNEPIATICQKIYEDYNSPNGKELVLLGLKYLLNKGPEGKAMLRQMSSGSDELSQKIRLILEKEPIENQDIEEILDIKRFPNLLLKLKPEDYLIGAYDYLSRKGRLKCGFDDFVKSITREYSLVTHNPQIHLSKDLGEQTLALNSTFGIREPSYLEALGQEELLRLRMESGQKMLLLGSYGVYSAREFRSLAEKITRDPDTTVIDIHKINIEQINKDPGNKNKVIRADAKQMPFKDSSMDIIFTNDLFHFVYKESSEKDRDKNIEGIFKEAGRVLKKGGSFLICEQSYGKNCNKKDTYLMLYELNLIGKKYELDMISGSTKDQAYILRSEIGNAYISEAGLPHYDNCLISINRSIGVCARFVKI